MHDNYLWGHIVESPTDEVIAVRNHVTSWQSGALVEHEAGLVRI